MKATTPVESPYMTADEAMVYLRRGSRRALERLIAEHRLPYCRSGGKLLFDRREIDAWLRGHGSALELARTQRRRA